MSAPSIFSLTGPLPTGRVAIEASAGTGKTYTLAGLVVRYVAETEVPVDELLIVTFTRAAAAELRDRVRTRLTEAVAALGGAPGTPIDDEAFALLAGTDRDVRRDRLERAVVDFDTATITTIHGFAQQVLTTLGSAAPGDLDATLVDDTTELVDEVCTDVLAAESVADPSTTDQLPELAQLRGLVVKVLGNPGIRVVPGADDADSTPTAARYRRLVNRVVDEVRRRRRVGGTLSFDDVLTQLRDALRDSPAAVAVLRRRFRIALIDEFQDTDPVQWEIFSTLFGDSDDGTTLVLVADPKQAIYAFRGANVHTYLDAAYRPGTARSTLGTNWRSDGALLDALERLLAGATFGDPRIEFVPVAAAPDHQDRRLTTEGADALPALRVRAALSSDLVPAKGGQVLTGDAEAAIARDLARQVQELLETARLPARADATRARRVRPGDVAVLIGKHAEAAPIQDALRGRGIPAVVARGDSVARSDAATQWRWLLTALTRPADPPRARTAALSWFFGWSVAQLDAADDAELGGVQEQLFRWAEILDAHGTVDFCAQVWSDSGVTARVLASADGDRDLTDLDHVAGLLQTHAAGRRPTAAGLLATLDQLGTERSTDPDNDVTARRIESGAEAVQIMTVYAAKGLEFPVVCIPTLWRASYATARDVMFQDPDTGHRTFDIANGEAWPTKGEARTRKVLANEEAIGENLRLLYVALTRAQHQTLVWWTRARGSEITGLARVLFARDGGAIDPGRFSAPKVALPSDGEALAALDLAFAPAGDAVAVTITGLAEEPVEPWIDDARPIPSGPLELAVLDRVLARIHRRWSFSAISDRGHAETLDPGDESLGDAGAADEPADNPDRDATDTAERGTDLPLGEVAGGAQFGTLVHEVLERVDFTAVDLDAELRTQVADRLRWNPWPVDETTLVSGLRATIETPLGPLFAQRRLRDLERADRLDELSFELHLGGASRHATDRDVGALVLGHLPDGDPLRPWAERLASGLFDVELAGHLTGSIDAVFRVDDPADSSGPSRFVVVDYKTNRLTEHGREPQSLDYHPDRLPAAMAAHHYPLQALLYSVALHRYLRWRLVDYEPTEHLGGVAYLFVRGMAGADTPTVDGHPFGVFAWRVPADLVTGLSDLLDGRDGRDVLT
ncbi:MAG TPA: UvrD-helicase domain-containing protein [Acidimicrobiia bacterium]|nr:UvrD-helicase domain-containing protein [Acidimicrobiia bacterium]